MTISLTILTGVLLILFGITFSLSIRIKRLEKRIGVTDTRVEVVHDDQRDSIQQFKDELNELNS